MVYFSSVVDIVLGPVGLSFGFQINTALIFPVKGCLRVLTFDNLMGYTSRANNMKS